MRVVLILLVLCICVVSVKAHDYHVLLTGYEPFLNYSTNPSGEVAQTLNGKCKNVTLPGGLKSPVYVCFEGMQVPVNRSGARKVADGIVELFKAGYSLPWDAVIHMGLEDSARGLKIETVGANILAESNSSVIVPGGPDVLPITANLGRFTIQRLSRSLRRSHVKDLVGKSESWSRDAGTYYCNEMLFRTVYAVRQYEIPGKSGGKNGDLIAALFVHLPDVSVLSVEEDADLVTTIAALVVAASQ